MKKLYVVIGIMVSIALFAGIIAFVWPMLAAMSVEGGLAPAIIMIVACFAIGGVLIFLLLYSARRGYDVGGQVVRGQNPMGDETGLNEIFDPVRAERP